MERDGSGNVEKRIVQLELDIDTNVHDSSRNPFQNLIHLAKAIDAWRVFPRMFIGVYIYLLYEVTIWYMSLESPSMEQSGLISVMTGVGAAWFGLYTKTKGDGDS